MTRSDHDIRRYPAHSKRLALRGLLACLLGGAALSAQAVYVNGSTPPGFSGSPGAWVYKPGSAERWLARTAATTTTVNVGGRAVTMNALLRMSSSGASRIAAAAVWTPMGRAAAVGLTLAALSTQLLQLGIEWSQENQRWEQTIGDGRLWSWTSSQPRYATAELACRAFISWDAAQYPNRSTSMTYIGIHVDNSSESTCLVKETDKSSGAVIQQSKGHGKVWVYDSGTPPKVPISQSDFEDAAMPHILPEAVPDLAPNVPLPVELPIINPSEEENPKARPLRVPIGDPIADPKPADENAPQVWRQPVVDIVPSPTTANPWRVDAQPKDIVTESPQGQPAPDPITEETPVDSGEDTKSENKPDTPGLCEMYPDILACAKPELDTPDDEIPKAERDISYMTENLFGGGSCPANPSWTDKLGSHELNLGPFCDITINVIRPILLAMAALAALFIILPFRSES